MMVRPLNWVCHACRTQLSNTRPSTWSPNRAASTLQRRRPSRVILSSRVAQPIAPRTKRSNVFKGRSNGPFGAINSTSADIRDNTRMTRIKDTSRLEPRSARFQSERRQGRDKQRSARPDREGFHALKMQQALATVPYSQRAHTRDQIANVEQFDELSLLPAIRVSVAKEALKDLESITPTPIQRLAISELLAGTADTVAGKTKTKQYLLAAETGSGKTLAYLLPTLDAIKRAEARERITLARKEDLAKTLDRRASSKFDVDPPPLSDRQDSTAGKPRAIILVPSAELVDQVGAVAKSLSHTVKFRCTMLSANYSSTVIRNRLFSPQGIDLVITTPHLLSSIIQTTPSIVSQVSHIIIDEADSLLDRSFAPITGEILDRAAPTLQQLVLCSATIPRSLDSLLRAKFPNITRLTTPKLHSIPRRVQMTVVDASRDPYQGNKNLACADTIWSLGRDEDGDGSMQSSSSPLATSTKYIIVFVNTREQTAPLAEYLARKGIDAVALNRDAIDERKKGSALLAFTSEGTAKNAPMNLAEESAEDKDEITRAEENHLWSQRPIPSRPTKWKGQSEHVTPVRRLRNVKVLVTTDIASRGIDTTPVKHVVLYDVPHSTVDFIHRLGRVGRMGRRGRAVVLVGKGDRRDVVKEVRQGMFAGTALV